MRRHTSVPMASQAKRPTLHLLYDAAAKSRGALEDVTLLVYDEQGCVRDRIRGTPRYDAQQRSDRDEERAAQQRYEVALEARRTELERQANVTLTGQGAAAPQDQMAAARKAQGRPGERGRRAPKRATASDTPAPAAGRSPASLEERARNSPSKRKSAASTNASTSTKRADAPAMPTQGGPAPLAADVAPSDSRTGNDPWAAFTAMVSTSSRARRTKNG
ncbi:MAG: hypothetical protein IT360_01090 [Gemmatimonadaceae bacterium]|nr:hypothetical protein [Gemmatimonadaceae bacterium]